MVSQGEEGEVGERIEVGGERGTVCSVFSSHFVFFVMLKLEPQESELIPQLPEQYINFQGPLGWFR